MSKRKRIIIALIFGIIGAVFFEIIEDIHLINLKNKYSTDIRAENSIYAKVLKVVLWHGVTNVYLSNGKGYYIGDSRNYEYEHVFLDDNINVGDIIQKKIYSDSLWIINRKDTLVFVIGKCINKHDK